MASSLARESMGEYPISVEMRSLEETKADVITCAMSRTMNLKHGAATKALLEGAGNELQFELNNHPYLELGEIAVLKGYNLRCRHVFLGIMDPLEKCLLERYTGPEQYYKATVHEFMIKCLNEAQETECYSIAFPAVGTGRLGYPVDVVAKEMFTTAQNWLYENCKNSCWRIKFVIHPSDIKAAEVFRMNEEMYRKVYKKKQQQFGNSMYSKTTQSAVRSKSRGITQTSFQENPETSKKTVTLILPLNTTGTLIKFFHHETLTDVDSYCELQWYDDKLLLIGKPECVTEAECKIKQLFKEVESLKVDHLYTTFAMNESEIASLLHKIKVTMGVYCIYDDKTNCLKLYGRTTGDVHRAKQEVMSKSDIHRKGTMTEKKEKLQLPSNNNAVNRQFSLSNNEQDCKVFQTGNCIIKVYCADILNAPVECIVNAANVNLRHGGGVAGAIAEAAGKDLTQEGYDYLRKHGQLQVGQACYTGPGLLPFKMVIHAVGPCWEDYSPHSQKDKIRCGQDLFYAIQNSFILAEREKIQTIAIPAISSGIFGCPVDVCCVQYAKAILSYSSRSRDPVPEIHFVDINSEIIQNIQKTFTCMITAKENEHICRQKVFGKRKRLLTKIKETPGKLKSLWKPCHDKLDITVFPGYTSTSLNSKPVFCYAARQHQCVFVYTENLFTLRGVEMLALGETSDGKSSGRSSTKFRSHAGEQYKKSKEKEFSTGKNFGDIVVCKGGSSNFKSIAHAILYPKSSFKTQYETKQQISRLFRDLFFEMKKKKCHSLALALFGTGKGKADPEFYAWRFLEGFQLFCEDHKNFHVEIHLVHIEPEITRVAIDAIKDWCDKKETNEPQGSQKPTFSRSFSEGGTHARQYTPIRTDNDKPSSVELKKSVSTKNIMKGRKQTNSHNFTKRPDLMLSEDRTKESDLELSKQHTNVQEPTCLNDDCTQNQRRHSFDDVSEKFALDHQSEKLSKGSNYLVSGATGSMNPASVSSSDETENDDSADEQSSGSDDENNTCVICMEDLTDPKKLPCGHIFCKDCIDAQFSYKQACPMCGKVFGIITGDQPDGNMKVAINERASCAGYESYGRIEITYTFCDGVQGPDHPLPGSPYKGIKRTAYLPNNKQGKDICAMLQVAFQRKLVFTIGRSRTTGADGVITWNDIHHKTDPKPNTQFGYPDSTYLDRVTDELKIKGVTLNDIRTA